VFLVITVGDPILVSMVFPPNVKDPILNWNFFLIVNKIKYEMKNINI